MPQKHTVGPETELNRVQVDQVLKEKLGRYVIHYWTKKLLTLNKQVLQPL